MYVENRTKIANFRGVYGNRPLFHPAQPTVNFNLYFVPRVFNAPSKGVPLGILYRRRGPRKLE